MTERKRRTRREPESGEFRDPLSDYRSQPAAGEMERSMTEDLVTVIETLPVATIGPDATVAEAIRTMAERPSACLVVVKDDKPIGVFSERDVLNRIGNDYIALRDEPVSKHMTPDPTVVYENDAPARIINLMGTGLFRHIPVVDADGRLKGIIGGRRMTEYLREKMVGA